MQALYLIPGTAEDLAASIEKPVPLELVKEHFGPKYHDELSALLAGREAVYCWAMSRGDGRKIPFAYEKMEEGDIVLFKQSGTSASDTFNFLGEVIYKKPSSTFGGDVWPRGEDWHFIYFFKEIKRVAIDKNRLFSAIGYVPGRELSVQLRLAPAKLQGIYDRYDSLDAFLAAVISDIPIPAPADAEKKVAIKVKTSPGLKAEKVGECPNWLASVIEKARAIVQRNEAKLRDHALLVGKFYEACGFKNADAIRYYGSHIDVRIERDGIPLLVNAIKGDNNLSYRQRVVRSQAYTYAEEKGAPIVVITNGNYYAFLDRRKGLRWMENLVHELTLTRLTPNDVQFIESCPWLKPAD